MSVICQLKAVTIAYCVILITWTDCNGSLYDTIQIHQLVSRALLTVSAEDGQKLYVRLFLRKRRWIPKSKIVYDDIASDLSSILENVTSCGLIEDGLCYCLYS